MTTEIKLKRMLEFKGSSEFLRIQKLKIDILKAKKDSYGSIFVQDGDMLTVAEMIQKFEDICSMIEAGDIVERDYGEIIEHDDDWNDY